MVGALVALLIALPDRVSKLARLDPARAPTRPTSTSSASAQRITGSIAGVFALAALVGMVVMDVS